MQRIKYLFLACCLIFTVTAATGKTLLPITMPNSASKSFVIRYIDHHFVTEPPDAGFFFHLDPYERVVNGVVAILSGWAFVGIEFRSILFWRAGFYLMVIVWLSGVLQAYLIVEPSEARGLVLTLWFFAGGAGTAEGLIWWNSQKNYFLRPMQDNAQGPTSP